LPRGFRKTLAPQIEPRLGATWDLTGAGTTILHASAGYFHNARLGGGNLGNLSGNPPFIHNPIYSFGTISSLLAAGAVPVINPPTIEAIEMDYKTPSSYNWSAGLRREIGWGTAMDATYVGNVGRNMEMYYDLNAIPDGARFLDLHPENRDPTNPNAALPPAFLRPYRGYQNIRTRGNSGKADYHSFQLQVNRRYIKGIQFGGNYTWQRARGVADEDPGNLSLALNRSYEYHYGLVAHSQTHNATINYTWDIPGSHSGVAGLLLNGWQLSGSNSWVSGEWAAVSFTTPDNFDFTGGDGGMGACLAGNEPCLRVVRPVMDGDPMAGGGDPLTGWFNTAAFKRPSGRGDFGNAPRNAVQRPGINNWNLAVFKNVAVGGRRALQFRWEIYNVLDTVQFIDIDRAAVFNAQGVQTKATFGTALGIQSPTAPPRTMQLSARFTF
jgi:hypothetical protein